jgi:catechol 2,3-dioxygenase-like lactoylglutathione lyase family enzyme
LSFSGLTEYLIEGALLGTFMIPRLSWANTDSSIAFYRALGFRATGRSENYGNEQEHLNNAFAAHLRITSLRNDGGPGVELPEYLAPRDGRSIPGDQRPSDLAFGA